MEKNIEKSLRSHYDGPAFGHVHFRFPNCQHAMRFIVEKFQCFAVAGREVVDFNAAGLEFESRDVDAFEPHFGLILFRRVDYPKSL